MSAPARTLDRHWFAPAPLRDLGFVRIVLVASQLFWFFPDFDGMAYAGADDALFTPLPALKVFLLPFGWGARPDVMLLEAVWYLTIVAGILGIVGLYARPSLLAFAAGNTMMVAHAYSFGAYHHPEGPMILALWILAVSTSGRALSLDSLRLKLAGAEYASRFVPSVDPPALSPDARWPLRLVQWLIALVYLSAGMSKLGYGGPDWFNGYTLAYYMAEDGLRWGSTPALLLAGHPEVLAILSVGAVLLELTFFLAILVPRLTWPYILGGTALHAGIYITQRATFAQFIVLYVVYIELLRIGLPGRFRRPRPAQPKWKVVYDGRCPLCIRTMVILDSLDLRKRLAFLDLEADWSRAGSATGSFTQEEARHAMHMVSPDGHVYKGYFAFRALARLLPPLWLVVPALHAPFAGDIGSWIYRQMARNRGRTPCRADMCRI